MLQLAKNYDKALEDEEMTPALLYCGLANEDPQLAEQQALLPEETYEPVPPPPREEQHTAGETWEEGRLLAGSDGSGLHPREARLRRCGFALFYADDHPWSVKAALKGQQQTVPRSELRAMLEVIP